MGCVWALIILSFGGSFYMYKKVNRANCLSFICKLARYSSYRELSFQDATVY